MKTLKLKKNIDYEIKENNLYLDMNQKKFYNYNKDFKYEYIKLIFIENEIWRLELFVNDDGYCYFQEIKGDGFMDLKTFIENESELISIEIY